MAGQFRKCFLNWGAPVPLPKPRSRVEVDPNYEANLRAVQEAAAQTAPALRSGGQVLWTRPANWNGDPLDYEGIHTALNRDQANAQFVQATADAQAHGVMADLVAATLMVDYLGVLERAFKQRLGHGRVRRHALAAGRKQGQGSPNGVFITSNLGYVQRVVKKGKGPQ
jgi:hypothetical protein